MITEGDILAAAVTLFCVVIVPLFIWAIRAIVRESQRRITEATQVAGLSHGIESIRSEVAGLRTDLRTYMERTDERISVLREDHAAIRAIIRKSEK